VLEIACKLGGFSMGEADLLRKAMGKKNVEVMQAQQEKFMQGAQQRGVALAEASEIWEMMAQFAGYGFNKAHSVCYAWIAYQTAYLKCHYPHYYMCAMLNNCMEDAAKLAEILAQCRMMRIEVLPPSVSEGALEFTPTTDGRIIFGLGGIKGLGGNTVEVIVKERERGGPFADPADFLRRTKSLGVNRKVLQALAMAGAFDCLQPDRTELVKHLDDIEAHLRGPERQVALFSGFSDGADRPGVLPTKEVTERDVAMLEKQAIGVFLTHHPFENHPMYADGRYMQLAQLQESVQDDPSRWVDQALPPTGLAGLLTNVSVRVANTSKNAYAKARLEDPERSIAVLIWPRTYEAARRHIEENAPVVIWGRMQLPETAAEGEATWKDAEIVVDKLVPYASMGAVNMNQPDAGLATPGASPPQAKPREGRGSAANGQTQSSAQSAPPLAPAAYASPVVAEQTDDAFMPLPIDWELDLGRADHDALGRLARILERAEGNCEIRMLLREVSGQLLRVKVNSRFYTSLDVAQQLEREFPFITPLGPPLG
jgi:DNA polymerase-3 subunit alpha